MKYAVYNKDDTAVGVLSVELADSIIHKYDGHYDVLHRKAVFMFDTQFVYGCNEISLAFFPGTYIVLEAVR